MKLHLLNRSISKNQSFSVTQNSYKNFLKLWHHHPELELVAIIKSSGTRFIGDSIEPFNQGDLVLIGKNLPHMWLNDEVYFKEDSHLQAEAIAVHFKEDFAGDIFINMPETANISDLLKKAIYGIKFSGKTEYLINKIIKLQQLNGLDRILEFLKILELLAKHQEYKLLSSTGFVNSFNTNISKNLNEVYEYIFKNFNNRINLKDVAAIANMNPSSFSRFFKRVNRKTFSEYLNSVRVGYACKLLIENKYNIAEICYESGFNNISNFNRQFKSITKHTPKEYVKLHSQ